MAWELMAGGPTIYSARQEIALAIVRWPPSPATWLNFSVSGSGRRLPRSWLERSSPALRQRTTPSLYTSIISPLRQLSSGCRVQAFIRSTLSFHRASVKETFPFRLWLEVCKPNRAYCFRYRSRLVHRRLAAVMAAPAAREPGDREAVGRVVRAAARVVDPEAVRGAEAARVEEGARGAEEVPCDPYMER